MPSHRKIEILIFLGTNWGLSLGLEELDISVCEGELASAAWAHLFGSIGSDAKLTRLNLANSGFLASKLYYIFLSHKFILYFLILLYYFYSLFISEKNTYFTFHFYPF